jgi:hypothetical protein
MSSYEVDWNAIDEQLDDDRGFDPDDCSEQAWQRERAYARLNSRRQPVEKLSWEQLNSKLRDIWLGSGRTHWTASPNGNLTCVWDKPHHAEYLDFVRNESGFLFTRGALNVHLRQVIGLMTVTCLHADGNGVVLQLC